MATGKDLPEDNRLEALQENLRDALGETTFGAPMKVTAPGGKTIVFRRRQYEGRPDAETYQVERSEKRKATQKRSQAMGESWKKFVTPGKRSITERKDDSIQGKFPLAYELVEYVSGGGTVNNVARMMQLKPPTIHGIEDVADSVDWHFLNRGIGVEHLETALSKDGKQVLVFMDDRATPRLPQIKEVLSKFGEARILQRADEISEDGGQPHGFYVFELSPDNSIYQPQPKADPNPKDGTWNPDTPQPNMVDDLEDDDTFEVILEEVFEPFCSTCGDQMFEGDQRQAFKPSAKLADKKWQERQAVQSKAKSAWKKTAFTAESEDSVDEAKKKNDPNKDDDYDDKDGKNEFSDYKSSEAFDAKVGDPKGKKKKDHPSTLGDSVSESAKKAVLGVGALSGLASGSMAYRQARKAGLSKKAAAKKAAKFGAAYGAAATASTATGVAAGRKLGKIVHGESLEFSCDSCGTDATNIDEHEFSGYYCARHGDRLDKYSRACNECQEVARFEESVTVACPECHSSCSLEESECQVCGVLFEDGVADFAEHVAEAVAPLAVDENITLSEHDWTDSYSAQLADTLFADVEDDPLPF